MKKDIWSHFLAILTLAILSTGCKKDPAPLTIPNSLKASDTLALMINLKWDAVNEATEYNIYRADYKADTTSLEFVKVGTSNENKYSDIDVVSRSSYFYKVEATRAGEKGPESYLALGKTKNITPDEAFDVLATLTGGARYNASSASKVPEMIVQIIKDNATTGTDLVFLIDNTISMNDDIRQVKTALNDIISQLPATTRLGAATYNDANVDPNNWFVWNDLTTDYATISTFVNNIRVYGGGDTPESVYDGLYLTIEKMTWSSTRKRMIILIGDAPPLEGKYSTYTLRDVIDKCLAMGVVANLYPILIK